MEALRGWNQWFLGFFIVLLLVAGVWKPSTVYGGGVQTLEAVEVTDSAENLIGSANSADEGTVTQRQLSERPLWRPGSMLESVPGLVVTQHSGAGKANQYFLRGFNLDHGTDFASFVDGMPVNMPTHGHGQGYSDLNFVIPELVTGLQYRKGPYAAETGDFASAGSGYMNYATSLDKGINAVTYGMNNYRRLVSAASTQVGPGTYLYGFEFFLNNGPWVNPDDYRKTNGVLRYTLKDAQSQLSFTAMDYTGKWNSTDQVAERAIDDPNSVPHIDRLGAIDPSDGGKTHRTSLSTEYQRKTGSTTTQANAYIMDYGLDLWNDFTYYTACDDPRFIAAGYTPSPTLQCDQFHQHDDRIVSGVRAAHTWFGKVGAFDMDNTVGLQIRNDNIRSVALDHTVQRQVFTNIRTDSVKELATGIYVQNGTRWTDWFRTVAGLRDDFYQFNVDSSIPVNSGDASDSLVQPKLSLIFGPWAKTEYYASAGIGFHSNDARGTTITVDPTDGVTPVDKVTPLVKTKGAEVGARTAIIPHLQSSLALWYLRIGSELVFSGDGGATEASFPTVRKGVEWANYYTPKPWLTIDADLSYTNSRYEDNPDGDHIENSLPYVIAAGVTIDNLGGPFGSIRLRDFAPGPLVADNSIKSGGSTTVDLQAGYAISNQLRFALDIFNLFNADYNDIDYAYSSCLFNELSAGNHCDAVDNGTNTLHIHPMETRQARLSMIYNF